MGVQNDQYRFESLGRLTNHRTSEETNTDFDTFKKHLAIKTAQPGAKNNQLLRDYVSLHQGNIYWYVQRLKKEVRYRGLFIVFSIVLLASIPIAIIVVGSLATKLGAKSPAAVTAHVKTSPPHPQQIGPNHPIPSVTLSRKSTIW